MKHILLPTDFSENSWNAITYAIKLFKNEKCVFHLLNTYTPVIYHVEYVLGYPAQFGLGDAVRNTSQENLKELVERISIEFPNNPNHKFETLARFDTLISGIKEFLNKHKTHIIVMGTKGATGAKEVLFGSNTVNVFNEIKYPVLAIPSDFEYENPLEILFPTDLEANYKDTQLSLLKEIAKSHNSRINAMHVSTGYELTEEQISKKQELETLFKDNSYLFHDLRSMNVDEAINEFQIKTKTNMLVMINNKHSFFENLFFQSKVKQIGFHLHIPFLVIPSAH
ncbi:universal stress protein [uncultured Winogradskyella sp.]|uniref:universal stress protein n=1 Tax=uncultured Winogradskyella sp. TaxID=395353 RepID=UPI002602A94E|nr:universal stress protein [uncultured Winogradskyella sp.]